MSAFPSKQNILFLIKKLVCKHIGKRVLLLEDNDVPVHELIQGLVQRDIIVLYPLC